MEKKVLSSRITKGSKSNNHPKKIKSHTKDFLRKKTSKLTKITKTTSFYLKKLTRNQKVFTFKISWKNMRKPLKIPEKY